MIISPSVIATVEESSLQPVDKKVHMESREASAFRTWPRSTENIFAGFSTQGKKKPIPRPVMLCVKYIDELVFDEKNIVAGGCVVCIDERTYTTLNEINSAVKESMRVEKVVIQRLERNEAFRKSKYYITTVEKKFFISKQRLLGEILKTQRKIEKVRPLIMLSIQMALENQIKKLCALKVIADKMYSEESSRTFVTM
ncbi:hypothetical protein NEAUS06_1450 [Nematocida ausubeli]|nr:hypothetical protein NEAUS06_1450 [Nematocida ausubeli]